MHWNYSHKFMIYCEEDDIAYSLGYSLCFWTYLFMYYGQSTVYCPEKQFSFKLLTQIVGFGDFWRLWLAFEFSVTALSHPYLLFDNIHISFLIDIHRLNSIAIDELIDFRIVHLACLPALFGVPLTLASQLISRLSCQLISYYCVNHL